MLVFVLIATSGVHSLSFSGQLASWFTMVIIAIIDDIFVVMIAAIMVVMIGVIRTILFWHLN